MHTGTVEHNDRSTVLVCNPSATGALCRGEKEMLAAAGA